jgi:acyl dehydratase
MGLEINGLRWVRPVRPGDTLQLETVVTELRPSRSKPDRGVVVFRSTTRNQRGETVQEMTSTVLVLRSDAAL